MNQKATKYSMLVLLVVFFGLGVFIFVKNTQLKGLNAELQETVVDMEAREKAIKKKYSEQKAQATALQRAKLATDSQMRTLETENETLQKEMERARGDQGTIINELEKRIGKVTSDLSDMSKAYDELSAQYTETVAKLGMANQEILDLNGDLAQRKDEISELESELKTALQKIERVVAHNGALAEIGEELLAEFDKKDVFASLLEKEPFTQAKRVSLETMIQEYLNRIDSEVLTGTDEL
jgi:chromosome segregation ATPase